MQVLLIWAIIPCLHTLLLPTILSQTSYDPPFMYLLNCGLPPNSSTLFENRHWLSDDNLTFLSSPDTSISASYSINGSLPSSAPISVLLSTARIFTSPTSYRFPITPGRYWVRLYFYPFPYQQFDPESAVFSVSAASYTLLFDVNMLESIRSNPDNTGYLLKEYTVIGDGSSLVITFIPNGAESSYAFVNAMEILSVPSGLFDDDTSPLGVNSPTEIGIPYMAMETMYRLNVGGPIVTPINDTQGLFRTWLPNETFLSSSIGIESINTDISSVQYTSSSSMLLAPPIVYSTALQVEFSLTAYPQGLNLSYVLPVQEDYQYVVRLHFCEIVYLTGGKRVFNVFLQNQTAFANLDLGLIQTKQTQAYYRDFSLQIPVGESTLWIQAGPPPNSTILLFNKAILNGIEVWKLNNSHASLDGLAAQATATTAPSSKHLLGPILGASIGIMVALGLLLMSILAFKHCRQPSRKKDASRWLPLSIHYGSSETPFSKTSAGGSQKTTATGTSVASPSAMGRYFTLDELQCATDNFHESRVLGEGGFGKVYLGELDDGTKVAVKRGHQSSQQGLAEFKTEIDMLSKLRHRHLVSLIGHCEEQDEMMLVYEYMAHGPLRKHLYGSGLPPLSWRRRLEICIGAAKGIHYLHTGAAQSIIHRDVKTTNILLDDNFGAKMSDFGLSKTGPSLDQTHVSTAVKGSFGYLDPEYFRRQQLTEKSDVYSLGVVLLEVLCARPPINTALTEQQVNLAEWALEWQSRGMLEDIIDPHLAGTIHHRSLAKFADIAQKCVAGDSTSRPTIGDVLWSLESALQLQENAGRTKEEVMVELDDGIDAEQDEEWENVREHEEGSSRSRSEEENARDVFSQLVLPQGR